MNLFKNIKTLGQNIIDLVFPVSCLICGKEEIFLCQNCAVKLPRQKVQKCVVCALASPFGKTHPGCKSKNTIDGLISALPYPDPQVKKIIEVFKYNFVSGLSHSFADLIFETIKHQDLESFFEDALVVPVPLHSRRLRWRGFNQAELLSSALVQKLKSGTTQQIKRIRFTKPQVDLSASERKINIKDAFAADQEF
ncbi:MAG TPA: double zinc ribbon domain-containing protein, partial [Patescibacteria group bacterium]|nr:double zinc ribbon domain-containing protein [Patescibacteria group bacterium]